jgi:hypothetical protein
VVTPAIKVQITGGEEAYRYTKDVLGRWGRYQKVFETRVIPLLAEFFEDQFATEGSAGGEPWEPLKPTTLMRKKQLGFADKGILRRKDKLYDALTSRERGTTGRRIQINQKGLRMIVTLKYGALHQEGSPGGRIPARVLVPDPMPDEFMGKLRKMISGYLLDVGFT